MHPFSRHYSNPSFVLFLPLSLVLHPPHLPGPLSQAPQPPQYSNHLSQDTPTPPEYSNPSRAHGTPEASVGAGLGGASSQDPAADSAAAGENTNGSAAASAPDDSQPQQDKQQDTLVIDVLYFEVAMAIEVDGILGPLRGIAIEVDGVLGPLRDVTTPVLPINYNPTPTNKPYILTPKPQAAGRLIRELQERKHDIQDGSYIPEEFRDLVLNRSSQFPYWR